MITAAASKAQRYQPLNRYRRFLAVSACLYLLFGLPAFADTLDIIANQSVLDEQLTRSEIRQIFTASKQYWPDGSKITVFVMDPRTSLHKNFCRQKLNMFPYQLERLWNQVTFSGQGNPPVTVGSQAELLRAVETTPGAIGYVADGVTGDVQIIKVGSL